MPAKTPEGIADLADALAWPPQDAAERIHDAALDHVRRRLVVCRRAAGEVRHLAAVLERTERPGAVLREGGVAGAAAGLPVPGQHLELATRGGGEGTEAATNPLVALAGRLNDFADDLEETVEVLDRALDPGLTRFRLDLETFLSDLPEAVRAGLASSLPEILRAREERTWEMDALLRTVGAAPRREGGRPSATPGSAPAGGGARSTPRLGPETPLREIASIYLAAPHRCALERIAQGLHDADLHEGVAALDVSLPVAELRALVADLRAVHRDLATVSEYGSHTSLSGDETQAVAAAREALEPIAELIARLDAAAATAATTADEAGHDAP